MGGADCLGGALGGEGEGEGGRDVEETLRDCGNCKGGVRIYSARKIAHHFFRLGSSWSAM